MIKWILSVVLPLNFAIAFSQNITKITFKTKFNLQPSAVQGAMSDSRRKQVIEQINLKTHTVYLSFDQNKNVWYQSDKLEDEAEMNMVKNNTLSVASANRLNTFQIRLYKNFETKECKVKNGDLIETASLVDIAWVKTAEVKRILGYLSVKYVANYKGMDMYCYVTKEIKGTASTGQYNELDGVVLEFDGGTKSGIATKVEFNQLDIKDFFK